MAPTPQNQSTSPTPANMSIVEDDENSMELLQQAQTTDPAFLYHAIAQRLKIATSTALELESKQHNDYKKGVNSHQLEKTKTKYGKLDRLVIGKEELDSVPLQLRKQYCDRKLITESVPVEIIWLNADSELAYGRLISVNNAI